jgi:undecaprenyl-diphosphatase
MIGISELGSALTIAGLGAALTLYLVLKHRWAPAQGVVLVVATSAIGTLLLKMLVARARPPQSFWAYMESGFSFPSAHATMSLAFYGFVLYVICRTTDSRRIRIAAAIVVAALVLAIGFSRLYLGVHYFSDVLGGYLLGAGCVWLSVKTTRMLSGD